MLVWKGKIIEKLDTECEHGDYICEFGCNEIKPFRLRVCGQLFVEKGDKTGDDVSIPMKFWQEDRLYDPAVEKTSVSCPV